jgi:hypothetical protein
MLDYRVEFFKHLFRRESCLLQKLLRQSVGPPANFKMGPPALTLPRAPL